MNRTKAFFTLFLTFNVQLLHVVYVNTYPECCLFDSDVTLF
jgi:hypothetical protein